jgi:hypothetical protein
MNSIKHIELATFQELKEALQIKRMNEELCEYLASSLRWILYYSKKNNMPIPDRDKIVELINRVIAIENGYQSPTESQQRNKTTEDSTAPMNVNLSAQKLKILENISQ